MTSIHFAGRDQMWTLCRLWADAVSSTTRAAEVTCPRCKHALQS